MRWEEYDWLLDAALREDSAEADVTTGALIPPDRQARAEMTIKEDGVICGLPLAERLLKRWEERIVFEALSQDGEFVSAPQVVATLEGPAGRILSVERTMLNFLQRLSGVATMARRYVDAVAGTGAVILDTRKTTPGWRDLEKYAVRCGGASNHRGGLGDQALIKENHLALMEEGVEAAVRRARERVPAGLKVEVEVKALDQLTEAVRAGADIIMLDNMTPEQVAEAVALVGALCEGGRRPLLEASGRMTLDGVRAYAEAGVDWISVGALTHSAAALDIALDMAPE